MKSMEETSNVRVNCDTDLQDPRFPFARSAEALMNKIKELKGRGRVVLR